MEQHYQEPNTAENGSDDEDNGPTNNDAGDEDTEVETNERGRPWKLTMTKSTRKLTS